MGLAVVRDLRPDLRLDPDGSRRSSRICWQSSCWPGRRRESPTDDPAPMSRRCWTAGVVRPAAVGAEPPDLDRFFGHHRPCAAGTKVRKATAFAVFFEFLELRHKPDIHAATGFVVESPLDEVNRPRGGTYARLRIPPSARRSLLFNGWRHDCRCPQVRPGGSQLHRVPVGQPDRAPRLGAVSAADGGRALGPRPVRQDPAARQGQPRPRQEGTAGPADQRRPGPAGVVGDRAALGIRRPSQRPRGAAVPLRAATPRRRQPRSTDDALRDGLAEAVSAHLPCRPGGCPRTCCGTSPPRSFTAAAWM